MIVAVYIEETNRAFSMQINDRISAHANKNFVKLAFAKHLLENDHNGGEEVLLHLLDIKYARISFFHSLFSISIVNFDLN